MRSCTPSDVVVSGLGVVAAIGQGRDAFARALYAPPAPFGVMQRTGRQKNGSAFLGAELPPLTPTSRPPLPRCSLSAQAALLVADEAWHDAQLDGPDGNDGTRVGVIIGGSNVQQRELVRTHEELAERSAFVRPTYALSFLDSDLCGLVSERLGIRGLAYTVGGASASGQLAIIQALHAVRSGQVDVCLAVGALMDLSYWECRAFSALGAMGSERFAAQPERACRPFDQRRDGFIFGECSGAVVVESAAHAAARGRQPWAWLAGWGLVMDAHRNPDPSLEGEIAAIRAALDRAGCAPHEVDYVNPHGTGSPLGDRTEVAALRSCELTGARINATKALIGHGLSAAGTVEVVATLLQMHAQRLHPTRNLDEPIDAGLRWVGAAAEDERVDTALTLSLGFGGINTALCLRRERDWSSHLGER